MISLILFLQHVFFTNTHLPRTEFLCTNHSHSHSHSHRAKQDNTDITTIKNITHHEIQKFVENIKVKEYKQIEIWDHGEVEWEL